MHVSYNECILVTLLFSFMMSAKSAGPNYIINAKTVSKYDWLTVVHCWALGQNVDFF